MHERVADRAFDRLAEPRASHKEGVNIHPISIERNIRSVGFLVVYRNENQIDVGSGPYRVVREAAAENGREDRRIHFYLLDECIERFVELLLNRAVPHHCWSVPFTSMSYL